MRHNVLVMVVEDNDALREATVVMLNQAGFQALGVPSAEDLDDTTLTHAPDLYVVDLNLPGEDGLSLAGRLRKAQPSAGIVITTARTQTGDRVVGYAVGADIYMPKPVDPRELLAALTALAKRMRRQDATPVLSLLDRQSVLRGPAGECKVADSELRLLVAFTSARDQTLERWQVAVQLSPQAEELSADNLQNRISQLRRKIQSCGVEGEAIKAIRGTGYRLCVPLVLE